MARMPRLVVPHFPHHVTQRGSRRQTTFYSPEDYEQYIDILATQKAKVGSEIWAYCLMPNHVHVIVVPHEAAGLSKLFGEAHRLYARRINERNGWQGHFWQERFHSFAMEERHALAAVRYTELNPVRAGLCDRAEDWPWSSVHAHSSNAPDRLTDSVPMLEDIENWQRFLGAPFSNRDLEKIRRCSKSGRPHGNPAFIERLEKQFERRLTKHAPGRKPRYK